MEPLLDEIISNEPEINATAEQELLVDELAK